MKKQYILGGLGVIVIGVLVFGYSMWNKYAPSTYVTENGTVDQFGGFVSTTTPLFTLQQVATHKDATSCFTVINQQVYDLTLWVNLHPGGKKAILSICGIDGTERFMKKHHGGEKFMNILKRFQVGKLQA